jgi:hypothetical protein
MLMGGLRNSLKGMFTGPKGSLDLSPGKSSVKSSSLKSIKSLSSILSKKTDKKVESFKVPTMDLKPKESDKKVCV